MRTDKANIEEINPERKIAIKYPVIFSLKIKTNIITPNKLMKEMKKLKKIKFHALYLSLKTWEQRVLVWVNIKLDKSKNRQFWFNGEINL